MQDWERRSKITTPESVTIDFQLAGPGTRFLALFIDLWVVVTLMTTVTYVLLMLFSLFFATGVASEGDHLAAAILVSLIILIEFLIFFGYWFALEAFGGGRTLGKRALGIRAVMRGGYPLTMSASLIRNLVRIVDMIPPPYFAVGLISMALSKDYQRLGDLAAGTIVVRDRSYRAPASGFYFAGLTPAHVLHWDTSAVSNAELELIRRFLARRTQLRPGARYSTGIRLAQRFRQRISGADPNLPPEVLLEGIVLERQVRSTRPIRAA